MMRQLDMCGQQVSRLYVEADLRGTEKLGERDREMETKRGKDKEVEKKGREGEREGVKEEHMDLLREGERWKNKERGREV